MISANTITEDNGIQSLGRVGAFNYGGELKRWAVRQSHVSTQSI